ncbi:MAG: hypothetical protein CMF74_00320 [Maricaulis sp.]|jgi:hypothetical protein|nr:hypothetical protein [Maricaulis sp.]|tara:strand:- start:61 stop:306 length:246 start_codon:yes stop_codon:yes gene_type:complete
MNLGKATNFYRAMQKYADEQIKIAREREAILSEIGFDISTKEDIDYYLLGVGTQAAAKKMMEFNGELYKQAVNVARQNHAR